MKITRRQAIQTTALTTGSLLFPKALQSANMETANETKGVTLHLTLKGRAYELKQLCRINQENYLEITILESKLHTFDHMRSTMAQFRKAFLKPNPKLTLNVDQPITVMAVAVKSARNNPELKGNVIMEDLGGNVVIRCNECSTWEEGIRGKVYPYLGLIYIHRPARKTIIRNANKPLKNQSWMRF